MTRVNNTIEADNVESVKLLLMGKETDAKNAAVTTVKLTINGIEKRVKALMDTGALINIIPSHMIESFGKEPNEDEGNEINIAGKETALVMGKEKAKIEFNGMKVDVQSNEKSQ